MTTVAGLSDDRIEAIIRNHEANPEEGDDSHTPREVVQLAREVKATRAARREALHAERNRLAPFASATETVRELARRGLIDLSGEPDVARMLDRCHGALLEMEGRPGPGPAAGDETGGTQP